MINIESYIHKIGMISPSFGKLIGVVFDSTYKGVPIYKTPIGEYISIQVINTSVVLFTDKGLEYVGECDHDAYTLDALHKIIDNTPMNILPNNEGIVSPTKELLDLTTMSEEQKQAVLEGNIDFPVGLKVIDDSIHDHPVARVYSWYHIMLNREVSNGSIG